MEHVFEDSRADLRSQLGRNIEYPRPLTISGQSSLHRLATKDVRRNSDCHVGEPHRRVRRQRNRRD